MSDASVLVQMAQAGAQPLVAPDTMLAKALRRGCDKSAGLDVLAREIQHHILPYSDAVDQLHDRDLLVALKRDGVLVGALAVSLELRAGLVEVVAAGRVSPHPAEDRPPSGTDLAVAAPSIRYFLTEAERESAGTAIGGWLAGISIGERLASSRVLDLTLDDEQMAVISMDVTLCGTDRVGQLRLLLPDPKGADDDKPGDQDWLALWGPVARSLPVRLSAQLHQMVLGLRMVEDLDVGDLVPLAGADAAQVHLVDPSGVNVATGRLGQMGGSRAIRLQTTSVSGLERDDMFRDHLAVDAGAQPTAPLEIELDPAPDIPDISDGAETPDFASLDMPLDMPTAELDGTEAADPSFAAPDLPELPELPELTTADEVAFDLDQSEDARAQDAREAEAFPDADLPDLDFPSLDLDDL